MIPNAKTRLFGLIGTPIDHSFSPTMHNTAFEDTGVNGVYLAFDTDGPEIEASVEALKRLGAVGWNVTMPCKSLMAGLCDRLSPEAEMIGAVNTVVNKDGVLTGYSTDGIGFFRNAKEHGFEPKGKKVVLAGAGGAARSIAAQAVLEEVGELVVYNRTLENAERLIGDIGEEAGRLGVRVSAKPLEDKTSMERDLRDADLFINATSVGMDPLNGGPIVEPDWLKPSLTVADIVYNPPLTGLLKTAAARGCRTLDGLGMVLWQGAYAFEYWTGVAFPVGVVKEKVFNAS